MTDNGSTPLMTNNTQGNVNGYENKVKDGSQFKNLDKNSSSGNELKAG